MVIPIQTQESQAAMTPAAALAMLQAGNARFVANRRAERDLPQQVRLTSGAQYPFAFVLGCVDSRVSPELVFDQGIGDIFSARLAGNVVNADVLGSMEFACKLVGVRLIVVLGHSGCGAVMGACDGVRLGHLTGLLDKLRPAVEAVPAPLAGRSSSDAAYIQQVAETNVALTAAAIPQQSPVLSEMLAAGEIMIAGAMYDVGTGTVTFL